MLHANAVMSISCTFLPSLLSLYYVTLFFPLGAGPSQIAQALPRVRVCCCAVLVSHVNAECFPQVVRDRFLLWVAELEYGSLQNFTLMMNC